MRIGIRRVGFGLATLGLGAGAGVWLGANHERRLTRTLIDSLLSEATSSAPKMVSFSELEALPPPVARYLRSALAPEQRRIRSVRIRQSGTLLVSPASDRRLPFEAQQAVAIGSPGFVWSARVRLAPGVSLGVRDAYLDGGGSGRVALWSALPLAREEPGTEMSSGALQRYLAEAAWYPTALLPSEGVRWTDLDDRRALATLADHGIEVSLEFRFDEAGLVESIYTPARWGRFDGRFEQHAWEGFFRRYERHDGILVPTEAEVGWHLPQGWWPFWHARVSAIEHEPDPSR